MPQAGLSLVEPISAPPERHPILEAIHRRRSIGKVTAEVPERSLIRRILEAGTWAPNHHLTEPWRFVVLEGEPRFELGKVMGAVAANRELDPERKEAAAAKAAAKPLRAPYVIAVAVEPSLDPSVPEIEEVAAGAAAIQNMLLAAEALGLAAMWRTGWIAFEPAVREHLGLSTRAKVLGFVYVGFAAMVAPERSRRDVDELTTWRS